MAKNQGFGEKYVEKTGFQNFVHKNQFIEPQKKGCSGAFIAFFGNWSLRVAALWTSIHILFGPYGQWAAKRHGQFWCSHPFEVCWIMFLCGSFITDCIYIHKCVYIYIYICTGYIYVYLLHMTCICKNKYVYVCIYIYTYVCIYKYM